MSAEPIDKMSSMLLDALDKLNWDVNRKVLQFLLDNGEQKVSDIYEMISYKHTYHGFTIKLSMLEKANLIDIIVANDQRTIHKIKLTAFGQLLLRNLLAAQKLLEMEPE